MEVVQLDIDNLFLSPAGCPFGLFRCLSGCFFRECGRNRSLRSLFFRRFLFHFGFFFCFLRGGSFPGFLSGFLFLSRFLWRTAPAFGRFLLFGCFFSLAGNVSLWNFFRGGFLRFPGSRRFFCFLNCSFLWWCRAGFFRGMSRPFLRLFPFHNFREVINRYIRGSRFWFRFFVCLRE